MSPNTSNCAVAICNNYGRKTYGVIYHRFPKDEVMQREWVSRCKRADEINVNNARVCSVHFLPEDYERDLKNELLGLPLKLKLKTNAIPSLHLPNLHCSRPTRKVLYSEDLTSDDESSLSEDNLRPYQLQMNRVVGKQQDGPQIKLEVLSDDDEEEEEVVNNSPASSHPRQLPIISNVHSLWNACTPRPQRTPVQLPVSPVQLPVSQQAVKVKKEPADEGSSGKRRVNQSSNLDAEIPSTSGGNDYSAKRRKHDDVDTRKSTDKSTELAAIHELLATIQKPVDEDQVFGEHIACELRAIRDTLIKRRCKCAITQALLNAMQEDALRLQQEGGNTLAVLPD